MRTVAPGDRAPATVDRRTLLLGVVGAVIGGGALSGCGRQTGNAGAVSNPNRTPNPSATPTPSPSAVAPTRTESLPPTSASRGLEIHPSVQNVLNPDLTSQVAREGEVVRGDPNATSDPTTWTNTTVLGVPVAQVRDEAVVSLAALNPDGSLSYVSIKDQLAVGDGNGGPSSDYTVRVPLGHTDRLWGFVSGDIDATPLDQNPDPSWAAESTDQVARNVPASDPRFAHVPLITL